MATHWSRLAEPDTYPTLEDSTQHLLLKKTKKKQLFWSHLPYDIFFIIIIMIKLPVGTTL